MLMSFDTPGSEDAIFARCPVSHLRLVASRVVSFCPTFLQRLRVLWTVSSRVLGFA